MLRTYCIYSTLNTIRTRERKEECIPWYCWIACIAQRLNGTAFQMFITNSFFDSRLIYQKQTKKSLLPEFGDFLFHIHNLCFMS